MPDFEAFNSVAAANVEAINGVSKSSCEAVQGVTIPSGTTTASRWVIGTSGGFIAHAANSDLTSWTTYDATHDSVPPALSIAFGKNANGQGIYVCTFDAFAREITVSGTDVTTNATWTDINVSPNDDQRIVMWGAASNGATAGTWITVGQDGSIFRSTDGAASWSAVDMSATNLGSGDLKGIASNGNGKWMFAQSDRLYVSTNDGATFTESEPWSSNSPNKIQGLTYTNATWVLAYSRSGPKFRLCADSDTSDWSDEYVINNDTNNFPTRDINGDGSQNTLGQGSIAFGDPGNSDTKYIKFAAYNGRVVAVSTGGSGRTFLMFDVNGKTLSNGNWIDPNHATAAIFDGYSGGDTPQDVATDGTTWVMSMKGGDIFKTTTADASDGWTQVQNDLEIDGSQRNLIAITCDVLRPI